VHRGLLLIIFDVLVIFLSLLMKSQAFALSGTGVGIREEGPQLAHVGDTIEYAIVVYNLGDYWIWNATITDTFPNGTSSSWQAPNLAPLGQSGSSFSISSILYTIQYTDLFAGNLSYITNHAEATGYLDIQGLQTSVHAETNYRTIVLGIPVGGYSISIKTMGASTPTTIYVILLSIVTAAFCIFSACKQKAYRNGRVALLRKR
jgi:uncharacterized repeat protein (TIGR01451 family)